VARALQDGQRLGHLDLKATELAILGAMHQVGGVLLEQLLNADEAAIAGPGCHVAEATRPSSSATAARRCTPSSAPWGSGGPIIVPPGAACQAGMIPKDRTLNIADTSFSPGVRRMIGRVGAKEPFDAGRRDLEALAGVVVTTKAVERWFLPRGTSSSVRQRASFVARCRMNLNHKLCLEPLHHGNCR